MQGGIPVEGRPSPIHGNGAFATRPISAGERIGEYTGSPSAEDGTYVLWVEGDDGEYRGIDGDNELRWLNHSSSPNVEFDGPELFALVEARGLGRVFAAPTDLQLSLHDVVQPDLIVVLERRRLCVTPTKIKGAPDLVIEIVSPSASSPRA